VLTAKATNVTTNTTNVTTKAADMAAKSSPGVSRGHRSWSERQTKHNRRH
jgi:hypothetical protein